MTKEPARILIVDDSRLFRCALEEALARQHGLAVAGSVFNGEKALDFIRRTPPDLVTLDVEMPGLDGLQTLEAIQQVNAARPPGTEIGVIMVSSATRRGAEVTIRALQAGAFDFVPKPTGPDEATCLAHLGCQLTCKIRLFLARRALGRKPCPCPAPPPANRAHWSRPGHPVRAVLIASSTGGPRALETVLGELRPRITQPILVVQHMPAPFTQSLADSLGRKLGTPVAEARDGDHMTKGTVLVAPGGKHMLLRRENGHVLVGTNELPPENHLRPAADVLFRSASVVLGGDCVAVVLTGMGTDGTAGLRPLKRAGAYVLAQDERSSVVWGMPGSVVHAGLADEVLPLDQIAPAVQALVASRGSPEMRLSPTTFQELSGVIRRLCGLVLGEEKAYLIEHRLEPLLRAHKIRDFDELAQLLRRPDGDRLHDSLIELITTAETSFFRDGHPFQTLKRELFPALLATARAQRRPVRLWSAAAATGQEAYSLAILVAEYVRDNPGTRLDEFAIVATDISPRVLTAAHQGEYTEREIRRGLTASQVARHFDRRGDVWRLKDEVRRLVEFRRLNLTESAASLGLFDVILCRNVLIYFDEATKRRIVTQLHTQLHPGGWLLLGSAENLYTLDVGFESVHRGETLLYRAASNSLSAAK